MNFKAIMMGVSSLETSEAEKTEVQNPNNLSPLFNSPSLENSTQIIPHKLNGKNDLEWSQTVRLMIDGKGKLGFLTGEIAVPTATDPQFVSWRQQNSMITAWLVNSMDPAIAKAFIFLPTAKDVWEAVRDTYSDLENYFQLFQLHAKVSKMQQGESDVTTYYKKLMAVFQKLELFETEQWINPQDALLYKTKVERGRV